MIADGSIRRHCRRRAVGIWEMRIRLLIDLHRIAADRGANEAEYAAIWGTVYELIEDELRSL